MLRIALIFLAGSLQTAPADDKPAEGPPTLAIKLAELMTRHQAGSEAPKAFEIEEREANIYIRQQSATQLPDGVESPWVRFEESLAVVGATLDIDKLRSELPDSLVFQLLSGRVPVEVTARIQAAAGVGKLVLEKVLLSGVELPPDLIATLIDEEKAAAFLPPGFRLGEAFTLPYDVESIELQQGMAVVEQRASVPVK